MHSTNSGSIEEEDDSNNEATSKSRSNGFLRKQKPSPGSVEMKQPLTALSPEARPPAQWNGGTDNSNQVHDPFYVFREDLYQKLDLVDESLAEFLRIVQQTDTAVNIYEVKDAKKHMKRQIRNAEATLKDVNATVALVENQRQKFPHIDNADLYERRSLVTTSKERIARAKADMHSDRVKSKFLADEKAKALRRVKKHQQPQNGHDSVGDDINYAAESQAQTSLLMQEQDETLNELGDAVVRVGVMADQIHDEIGVQNKMLSDMEDDLADAEEKLGLVVGKLAKFLKTKNKWQLGTILILSAIVVILFFLVLYS